LRIGSILEAERGELDEVRGAIGTISSGRSECDLGVGRDIKRGRDVLENKLRGLAAGSEVNLARSDSSKKRSIAIVSPSDSAGLASSARSAGNGAGDVDDSGDLGGHGGDEESGRSEGNHFEKFVR